MTDIAYFDNNATTPIDPRVRDAMLPWLSGLHGNPSSAHGAGRQARAAVDVARRQMAGMLGAEPDEIVFTSSGTEANNTVIDTLARQCGYRGHLVINTLEHPSIHRAADRVEAAGMDVTELEPGPDGVIAIDSVAAALRDDTRLVCLMHANNELGTLQPVAAVAALCRSQGVPVLCDAVQTVSKMPVKVRELGVDYLTLGGHKFHGPLGIATLWVRPGAALEPMLVGAPQEGGRRASTENVPAIVGLGMAAELADREWRERAEKLTALRVNFEEGLERIPDAIVHCSESVRLPHTSHVAFLGVSGHELMMRLDSHSIAVSTGSACHSSGGPQPSRAVVATGVSPDEALASLRISFGITNTHDEVQRLLETLTEEVAALRAREPVAVG